MRFLLQTVGGKVVHDFVFELERSLEYQEWLGRNNDVAYCELEQIRKLNYGVDSDAIVNYVPVGTVEFVTEFCKAFISEDADKRIKPINVPLELMSMEYRGVKTVNIELTDDNRIEIDGIIKGNSGMYLKSNDRIKDRRTLHVSGVDNSFPNGNYQLSETIPNILSEYRCFVYNDRLLGIQWYSGDFKVFPDVKRIELFMSKYRYDYGNDHAPQAYTLDVYVSEKGTFVMEVHNLFSCGLYGFSDYKNLPYMMSRAFMELKKQILKRI